MIRRQHTAQGCLSVVRYSDCMAYRYDLTRTWDPHAKRLTYIMLNPSKADERANDPTVERCERRARAGGFGAMRVVNIFAWRDTDPMAMRRARAPIGPQNDSVLRGAARWADKIVAAWGTHGVHLGRGPDVAADLGRKGHQLYHLGLSKEGHPRHPLYIAYSTQPMPWNI